MAFDTLAYAKKLKSVGFTEAQAEVQAEAMAELIEERLATKRDLKDLEDNLRRDVKEMEYRIITRLGGITIVGFSILGALLKIH
ncbi:MAG: DUF1640 domain-containing protein [Magnetococcales bacterium]|nr:DUF1640 domain-containing protein [Magnetococcales bacterium]